MSRRRDRGRVRWVALFALVVIAIAWCAPGSVLASSARRSTVASPFLLAVQSPETPPSPAPAPDPAVRRAERARQREQSIEHLRQESRSARTAIFMSAVVPGWGQLYADSPFWSMVAFSVQMYYVGNIVMEGRRAERQSVRRDLEELDSPARADRTLLVAEHRERVRDYVWWGVGGLMIIALDAYVSVQLATFDSPYPPTPDLDKEWDTQSATGSGAGAGLAVRLDFAF